MDVTVSEAVAQFFYEQCNGTSSGHMAAIPNNTVLFALCAAHRVNNTADFARFIRQVADQLEKTPEF